VGGTAAAAEMEMDNGLRPIEMEGEEADMPPPFEYPFGEDM